MKKQMDKNPPVELFFGIYSDGKEGGSDGKEGSKDGGHEHLGAFHSNPSNVDCSDYQF